MLDFAQVRMDRLIIHVVGNKLKEEGVKLSSAPLEDLADQERELLLQYFLNPFKTEELFGFKHSSELQLNEVYSYVTKIFADKDEFVTQSRNIAQHLHECSTHPKIKTGEVYCAYFRNCALDGESVDAIGIFKSEEREKYIQAEAGGDGYTLLFEEGIHLGKPDKGCLILNTGAAEGYSVYIIGAAGKSGEAQYWQDDFLNVQPKSNDFHQTKNYLAYCKDFVTNKLPEEYEVSKADQIDLLNKSVEYFKNNDSFDEEDFASTVFPQKDIAKSFQEYKQEFTQATEIEVEERFDISDQAVKKQARVFKSVLKLDKNFHIYIHGNKELIEKGYDTATGKHYYKIYFDQEM